LFDYDYPLGFELVKVGDFLENRLGFKVDLLSKKAIRPQVWDFIQEEMHYV
jgi:predicted nucleotidyltransferase